MKTRLKLNRLCLPIMLALAGCDLAGDAQTQTGNGTVSEPASGEAAVQTTENRIVTMPESPKNLDAKIQALVDLARDDLVQRLEAEQRATDNITLLRAEWVTWRSGALGCPQPDRGYTMVLTPGVLIVLKADGGRYQYHSSPAGPPFLCEPPGRIESPAPGGDSRDPT